MTDRKRIVVGVDGSDGSRVALLWAYELATQRDDELLAVSVWNTWRGRSAGQPPMSDPAFASLPWGFDVKPEESAQAMLEKTLQEVFPDGRPDRLRTRTGVGNASEVLIQLSEEADLVVVGSRGHGGFAAMLLGSVSQHVAAHAKCSVVIAR
jgi:nucleotide-binding universal stress UspA family protein